MCKNYQELWAEMQRGQSRNSLPDIDDDVYELPLSGKSTEYEKKKIKGEKRLDLGDTDWVERLQEIRRTSS